MRDCWQYEPSDRPSFESIRHTLDEMLSRGDDPYFDLTGQREGAVDNDVSGTTQPIDGKHCYSCNIQDIFQQTIMKMLLFTDVVG